MKERVIKVTVRWTDGYLEEFECSDVRFGHALLWLRLTNKQNRHIPTERVRWYSIYPESHETPDLTEPKDERGEK